MSLTKKEIREKKKLINLLNIQIDGLDADISDKKQKMFLLEERIEQLNMEIDPQYIKRESRI